MGVRGKFLLLGLLVFAVLIPVAVQAQVSPDRGSEHRFWDTTNRLLFASHGALEAVDFGITHHNLSDGGREMDSMAKALCESGTGGPVGFLRREDGGSGWHQLSLTQNGHHKLERAPVYESGDSAYGVDYSFAHR